jgi:hypothetical protein
MLNEKEMAMHTPNTPEMIDGQAQAVAAAFAIARAAKSL